MIRPRSPLAHPVGECCESCRLCPSCAGGQREPVQYLALGSRAELPGDAVVACSRCLGNPGWVCPNVVAEPSLVAGAITRSIAQARARREGMEHPASVPSGTDEGVAGEAHGAPIGVNLQL